MATGIEYTLADPRSDLIFRSDEVMGWLRWLRQTHGLSQKALAEITDVSPSEIHKIERVQQECRLSSFAGICGALGVPAGWVLDLMLWSNISLFNQCILNDPDFKLLLAKLNAGGSRFRAPLGRQLAAACTMAAILTRCSAPVRRAIISAYPTDDLKARFLRFAHRLETQLTPPEKFQMLQNLRKHPCAELDRLDLLSRVSLEMQRDSLSLAPTERRQADFGWAPWVLTFEDAKRMWNAESTELENSQNYLLTDVAPEGNVSSMTEMQDMIARLRKATLQRGKKAELANHLGVAKSRVSKWLRKGKPVVPSGQTTLRLLHWVEQQERQLNTPGGAMNTTKGQTQSTRSVYAKDKAKSSPRKH